MEITLDTEMKFAREFWEKAIEGLDESDYPPKPDAWLDNAEDLKEGWEKTKIELIAMAESEDTPDEHKEDIRSFLECTLSIYVDLMCSISEQFGFAKPMHIPKIELMDSMDSQVELEVN